MKRLVISGVAAALVAGSAGLSFAAAPSNGGSPQDYGLCKAYFHGDGANGQGKGQGMDNKRSKQPFTALVTRAGDYNQDGTTDAQDVVDYCADTTPGGK